MIEGDQVIAATGQTLEFRHVARSTGPRSCQAFDCTIAARLVGAVALGEEPGVLLGS
jgi:hypothetical protein